MKKFFIRLGIYLTCCAACVFGQVNATGYITQQTTRPLGGTGSSVTYANFTSPTLPAGATIIAIYPEVTATYNSCTPQVPSCPLGSANADIVDSVAGGVVGAAGTPFSGTYHIGSIGTSYSVLAGRTFSATLHQSLFQDGLTSVLRVAGIAYAVYYTAPHPTVQSLMPLPVPVLAGQGVAWSMPGSFSLFAVGGTSTGTTGNPNPVGFITLGGIVNLPDAEHFNGSLSIKINKNGVQNICNYPYVTVPTQMVTFPIVNGIPIGIGNGVWASQDCLSPRVPYYAQIQDTNHIVVSGDNWYLPNNASAFVDIGDLQEQKFAGPISVAIPQAIISAPAGSQTVTQLAGTSFDFFGTVNFHGAVSYVTSPSLGIITPTQVLVNGITSSPYPLDVQGLINASAGYLVNGNGGVAGQALISDGTSFKPGNVTVTFPNQYYQLAYTGTTPVPPRVGLAFDTGSFTLSDSTSPSQTVIALNNVGTPGTFTNVNGLTLGADGRVINVSTSTVNTTSLTQTDVTGSRSYGSTFHNATAADMTVNSSGCITSGVGHTATIQGLTGIASPTVNVGKSTISNGSGCAFISFRVPAGWFYRINTGGIGAGDNSSAVKDSWVEWTYQ